MVDLSILSEQEKNDLLDKLSAEKTLAESKRRKDYEDLRVDFISRVKSRFVAYVQTGKEFKSWLRDESEAWTSIMNEYGKLKTNDQLGFSLSDNDFKMQVKGSRVKGFDERADVAEKRLVDFLKEWVQKSDKGEKDPMYKLAMMMIQRNEAGDLDYKSISRLYELESDFNDSEYSDIMRLFKESNVVEATAIHFYFETKDKYNVWRKMEPSFNRM